jgi:hypothetical protein
MHCGSVCCGLQEEQRAERQAAKAAAQRLSVRVKTTFASRQQALFSDDTIRTAFHETLQASKKVRHLQPDARIQRHTACPVGSNTAACCRSSMACCDALDALAASVQSMEPLTDQP